MWAPTLFGIFFSVLLQHAFQFCSEGGLLHRTRHDGKLLNLTRLRAKTKVKTVLLRETVFAGDAAFVSHTESGQQAIIDCFATACQDFGIKTTEVLAMAVRKAQAWRALNGMTKIWKSNMSKDLKIRFFTATIESILLYGCESWALSKEQEKSLDGTYTRMLR